VNDRLSELYRGVAVHATADREHEAALELLVLVMIADGHFDANEIETIREISEDWRGGAFSFDQYLGAAMAKVRRAVRDDATEELLDSIDERISSHVLRRALFSASREVAGIDDDVSPEEGTILEQVAVRFG
jgi:tellurite resistance protein